MSKIIKSTDVQLGHTIILVPGTQIRNSTSTYPNVIVLEGDKYHNREYKVLRRNKHSVAFENKELGKIQRLDYRDNPILTVK